MIHPTAIVCPKTVTLSYGVTVGPYCVLSNCLISEGSVIGPHVVIGGPPEHSVDRYEITKKESGLVVVGKNVIIREFSTVTRPTKGLTTIGDNVYLMGRCHVAHDCDLEAGVVMSIGATLAGHTTVMEGATIGIGAVTHQHTTIGQYCMVAGGAMVVKDLPPFSKYIPNRLLTVNEHACSRLGLSLPVTSGKSYAEHLARWDRRRNADRPFLRLIEEHEHGS